MDKSDGQLRLSNGSAVPLDSVTFPSPPNDDWLSPDGSLAASDAAPPRTVCSDPGHLPAVPPIACSASASTPQPSRPSEDACRRPQPQLRVDIGRRSADHTTAWNSPTSAPVSAGGSPLYRSPSPAPLGSGTRERGSPIRQSAGFMSPPPHGSQPALTSARSASERELKRKLAAEAALARVRDLEAKFGANGLSPVSRSCMGRDPGQPLKGSRQPSFL